MLCNHFYRVTEREGTTQVGGIQCLNIVIVIKVWSLESDQNIIKTSILSDLQMIVKFMNKIFLIKSVFPFIWPCNVFNDNTIWTKIELMKIFKLVVILFDNQFSQTMIMIWF